MDSRLARVSSCLIVILCASAPSRANDVAKVSPAQSPQSLAVPAHVYRGPRIARTNDARGQVVITGPTGCSTSGAHSFTGGGIGNVAGTNSGVLAGYSNESCDVTTAIGAGDFNIVGGGDSADYSAIVAGYINGVADQNSFIGGGTENIIGVDSHTHFGASAIVAGRANSLSSETSIIGAGAFNTIVSPASPLFNGPSSFIGAGAYNTTSSDFAVLSGGYNNSITGEYATIAGGYNNAVSGFQASIGGGYGNVASGRNAVVPGGAYNTAAGLDSFAAGNAAKATYNGTFVWSDDSAASGIASTSANQFLARAAGGFFLYSSANLKSGVRLAPGSGSWSSLSDRASKTGIENVNDAGILAKVASLPVSEWKLYRTGNGCASPRTDGAGLSRSVRARRRRQAHLGSRRRRGRPSSHQGATGRGGGEGPADRGTAAR